LKTAGYLLVMKALKAMNNDIT